MEYMLITQSTDWFRNNIPPGVFRLIECTKKQAIAYAKALFDEVVEQENHVMLSHDWDEQKGVGIIRTEGDAIANAKSEFEEIWNREKFDWAISHEWNAGGNFGIIKYSDGSELRVDVVKVIRDIPRF